MAGYHVAEVKARILSALDCSQTRRHKGSKPRVVVKQFSAKTTRRAVIADAATALLKQ